MAYYPGLAPHQFMPYGTWQANPWDTNPPLGTTPNIVWPQNQSPFNTQGGAAPWPHYNQQSLYPAYTAPQGLPSNPPVFHTNSPYAYNVDTGSNQPDGRHNLNKSANNMSTCPCCGNMTFKHNISKGYNASACRSLSSSEGDSKRGDSYNRTTPYSASNTSCYQGHSTATPARCAQQDCNHNAVGSSTGQGPEEACAQDPYTAYYMSQMKAYQEAIYPYLSQYPYGDHVAASNPQQRCSRPNHITNKHQTNNGVSPQFRSAEEKEGPRASGQQAAANQWAGSKQTLQGAYQQSVENMRKAQARFNNQCLHNQTRQDYNQQDQRSLPRESPQTVSVCSAKSTDMNSFSSC